MGSLYPHEDSEFLIELLLNMFDYSKWFLPELLEKAEQKTLIKRVKQRTSLQPCLDMFDINITNINIHI